MQTFRPESCHTRTLRRGWLAAALLAAACTGDAPVQNAPFVPLLAYRAIAPPGGELAADGSTVSRARFVEQMQFLSANGYSAVTVGALAEYIRRERVLPPRTVALVFEDAWTYAEAVASILDRFGFGGTFFIGIDVSTEGELASLDWSPLKAIASNPSFEFGGEPGSMREGDDLVAWQEGETPGRGPLDVVWQVEVSRQFIEMGLGRPVRSFAWPEGRISEELVQLAQKSGYTALVTRRQTTNRAGGDPLAIGRYPVLGAFGLDAFRTMVEGGVRADVAELLPPTLPDADSSALDSSGVAPPP